MADLHSYIPRNLFFNRPDLIPPGDEEKQGRKYRIFLSGILLTVIIDTVVFLITYKDYYRGWCCNDRGKPVAGNCMPAFSVLLRECRTVIPFILLAALMLVYMIDNYRYFSIGSKSIYLMKRLPDGSDLRKRCLALPVRGLCLTAAVYLVLLVVFAAYYFLRTPAGCLP